MPRASLAGAARRPALALTFAAACAACHAHGQPVGKELVARAVDEPTWPARRAARLLARHHARRPALDALPLEPRALLEHVRRFDSQVAVLPREPGAADASARLGVLAIDAPAGRILVPQPGGPAWRAGVRHPVRLADADPADAGSGTERIVGTRLDTGEPVDVAVERGPVDEGAVDLYPLGGRRILRVHAFVAGRTVASARWRLLGDGTRGARNADEASEGRIGPIVLDLRYCAGGDVFEATDFAGLWLPGPRPWTTLHGASTPRVALDAGRPGGTDLAAPDVLLVSEYTASACEQLVRGLARHAGSLVLGERTAGKCTVQTTYPLDRVHAIRFTTGTWTGPDGDSCDPLGIAPDRRVPGSVHADADVARALAGLGDG